MGAAGQPTPDSRRRLPRATAVAYEPILVPAAYGHYVETFAEVLPTLTAFLTSVGADVSDGFVQVQVAP